MAKYLLPDEIAELTQRIAAKYRIQIPKTEDLTKALTISDNLPLFITDGYRQLWIDRDYISYSTIFNPDVTYAYLTDKHIFQENDSYEIASKARGNTSRLPEVIKAQFKFALQIMIEDGKKFVILESV